MEEKIIVIGVRKLYSKKSNKDLYLVDYVDSNKVPQTDFITIEEQNKIASKMKPFTGQVGIFGINSYKKAYLKDIK